MVSKKNKTKEIMQYTAVIRTLGTAVYIAEEYPLPKETVGIEKYVYVKKGMVAQRALPYDEVQTEYMLCLDDDLAFPPQTVEEMFCLLEKNQADVIAPDIFPNAKRPLLSEMMMTLSGRMCARRNDNYWGYKIMRTGGYSYNKCTQDDVGVSQTNAGACFLCKKVDFLKIRFEEELWMDSMSYALGDDQVMYYKMFLSGLKQLTWYRHQFIHLDGGCNMTPQKEKMRLYGDLYFKTVFWHRFIYKPEGSLALKLWDIICLGYMYCFTILISLIKLEFAILKTKWSAIVDGWAFIRSDKYKQLPLIK